MDRAIDKLVSVAVTVTLLTVAAGPAGAAEDGETTPAWTDAIPPETAFVAKIESEAFQTFADAFSGRVAPNADRRLFAAESPISSVVAAFLAGELDDFIDGDSEMLASLEFEHVDGGRPLVGAVTVARHGYLLESIAQGRPPVDGERLVRGPRIRLVVPATDAEALRDEIRTTCETVAEMQCDHVRRVEAREGQVWIAFADQTEAGPREEPAERRPVDAGFADRRTPAMEALMAEGTGVALYARADAWRRMVTVAEGSGLVTRIERIAEASGEDRVYQIRRARRTIADAMMMNDVHSPSTREVEDLAIVARGDDGGHVAVEAIQTYTAYGAALADAGESDTALPEYGLARPVVSGEWRYDLKTAMGRATAPVWMSDPLLGRSAFDGAWQMYRETDGFVAFAALMNHPLSAVAGAVDALKTSGAMQLLRPEALGSLVAGGFSLDVDPSRIAEGRPGITGGVAFALRDGATSAAEQLIEVGQGMLGISVTSEVEQREGHALYKLALDHDGAFTAADGPETTRFEMQLNLDRLRAKVEMLGREIPRGLRGWLQLGRLLQGVEATVDANDRYRHTRLRFGPYRGGTLELPERAFPPAEPEAAPTCFREASRASARVYVNAVDQGPYYPDSKDVPGPTAAKAVAGDSSGTDEEQDREPAPSAELGAEARKAIDELIGRLEDDESACAETAGESWAGKVAELREYWQDVLDGKAKTYPQ